MARQMRLAAGVQFGFFGFDAAIGAFKDQHLNIL